ESFISWCIPSNWANRYWPKTEISKKKGAENEREVFYRHKVFVHIKVKLILLLIFKQSRELCSKDRNLSYC
ncbi:MAG: hypothetical protein VX067_03935, partial [Pseudomonadota bacterium]|nr:hypothetical protein [Pseudomonadota bacterium]